MNRLACALAGAALIATPALAADDTLSVDFETLTCKQMESVSDAHAEMVAVWLDGYVAGVKHHMKLTDESIKNTHATIEKACKGHGDTNVLEALMAASE